MEDDKWKVIDTHLNSMMDWASGIGSNPPNNQMANQRQGHIHRRSEPDVVMIRKAQMSRINTMQLPVPQSAPVQPGTFQLDWNHMPKRKLASCEDEPSDNTDFISENADMMQFPELDAFGANSHSENAVSNSTSSNRLLSVPVNIDSQPRPPPYPRATGNGPVKQRPFDHTGGNFHPPILVSEMPYNSNHMFPSIKGPPINHFGYMSPRTNRRSSVPVNQLNQPDPRAHSASPNITRRSTSTVQRRRTQDNFMVVPAIMQNSEVNSVASHPSITGGPTPLTSIYTSKTIPEPAITSFAEIPNKKTDDQEYTKALLQHQRDRMQRLQKELRAKKELLESLSAIVTAKEKEVFEKRNEKTSTAMPKLHEVTKLREVNREMEIDCNCMIKEVDMVKSANSLDGNFHEIYVKRNQSGGLKKKPHAGITDLPSPPLPPPPPPPVDNEDETKWSCKWCTFLNHAALDKCEVCEYRRERVPTGS